MTFQVGQQTTDYFDISQAASICSRRFYRQGLVWAVAGFTVYVNPAFTGKVTIAKLPSTWICSNAWHKAYAHWKKQQDQAISDAGAQSAVAKYRDFKIHMNTGHIDVGFSANAIPVDLNNTEHIKGEWMPSEIVIPQAVADPSGSVILPKEYYLHMVGENNYAPGNSRGIIEGYADSRSYPQSPDPVSPDIASDDNWLASMFDVGSEDQEVLLNATHVNDDLPYDQINYPGGETNAPTLESVHIVSFVAQPAAVTGLTVSRRLSGTSVPCGLLEVENTVDGPIHVIVHLIPGTSRGYMTQPMQDM